MMARKIDLVKDLPDLYRPPAREPVLVKVPEMTFLMIDGSGDPNNSSGYQQAVEALYAVSYTAKFRLKRGPEGIDLKVMPLEGLWWSADVTVFLEGWREAWQWTMMIAQPDVVTPALIDEAVAEAGRKKDLPALGKARLERFEEGLCAQILHVGPYSAEGPTIERLHAFIAEQGQALRGKHHEIYLGDPRRTRPERLRTILRQPVRAQG
jgi:hypothetical protein